MRIGTLMQMNATGNAFQNTLLLHPPLAEEYDENGLSRTIPDASHSAGIIAAIEPRIITDCHGFARYAELPGNLADKVIAAYKKEQEEK